MACSRVNFTFFTLPVNTILESLTKKSQFTPILYEIRAKWYFTRTPTRVSVGPRPNALLNIYRKEKLNPVYGQCTLERGFEALQPN
jgi:hypothetical protein